jgi:hypothetical protein
MVFDLRFLRVLGHSCSFYFFFSLLISGLGWVGSMIEWLRVGDIGNTSCSEQLRRDCWASYILFTGSLAV